VPNRIGLSPISNSNVLRSEERLSGALIGNFAAARAVAGARSVAFEVAK